MLKSTVNKTTASCLLALATIGVLSGCGQEAASGPQTPVNPPAGTSTHGPAQNPAAARTEAPTATQAAVRTNARIGEVQAVRIGGAAVKVAVLSYDQADSTASVQVTNTAPLVVDPAAFTLTTGDGRVIPGVAAVAAWDRDLATNDQTMGPVRFAGATAPAFITYAPAGADHPVVWSFN